MVVLDTSALYFWTLVPSSLTSKAEKEIQKQEKLLISAISIWEIGLKVKNQRLSLPGTMQQYLDFLRATDNLEIIPVDERILMRNLELEWDHRDPADRTIVATAMIHKCGLITSDNEIRQFYPAAIW